MLCVCVAPYCLHLTAALFSIRPEVIKPLVGLIKAAQAYLVGIRDSRLWDQIRGIIVISAQSFKPKSSCMYSFWLGFAPEITLLRNFCAASSEIW